MDDNGRHCDQVFDDYHYDSPDTQSQKSLHTAAHIWSRTLVHTSSHIAGCTWYILIMVMTIKMKLMMMMMSHLFVHCFTLFFVDSLALVLTGSVVAKTS